MLRIALLLIILVFAGNIWAENSQNTPQNLEPVKKEAINSQAINSCSDNAMIIVNKLEHTEQPYKCDGQLEKNWVDKMLSDPIATFSGLLVLVTTLLGWIGLKQNQITRIQMRPNIVIDETKDPESRYVTLESRGLGQVIVAHASVKNQGRTAALNVGYDINMEYRSDIPNDSWFKKIDWNGRSVLNQNQETILRVETEFTERQFSVMRSNFGRTEGLNHYSVTQ